jgi:hypothetical protein
MGTVTVPRPEAQRATCRGNYGADRTCGPRKANRRRGLGLGTRLSSPASYSKRRPPARPSAPEQGRLRIVCGLCGAATTRAFADLVRVGTSGCAEAAPASPSAPGSHFSDATWRRSSPCASPDRAPRGAVLPTARLIPSRHAPARTLRSCTPGRHRLSPCVTRGDRGAGARTDTTDSVRSPGAAAARLRPIRAPVDSHPYR